MTVAGSIIDLVFQLSPEFVIAIVRIDYLWNSGEQYIVVCGQLNQLAYRFRCCKDLSTSIDVGALERCLSI